MKTRLAFVVLALAACSGSSNSGSPTPDWRAAAPSPDPRVGLKAGKWDAASAAWNLRLVSTTQPSEKFVGVTNSDLAFIGNLAIQGNYNGYQVWDISDAAKPVLKTAYLCPASQSDVSVYRNLLFVSAEGLTGRSDCAAGGVPDTVSAIRVRGLRIFDITDISHPKYVANVQTCRGSHTHTVVTDPNDPSNIYVYISGSAGVRSPSELPGCSRLTPDEDPNSALFRIEVIKVPVANPQAAAIISSPRIFNNLAPVTGHGEMPADTVGQGARRAAAAAANPGAAAARAAQANRPRTGPTQCHDITVYPAIGLAGGACGGYGLLLDIRDPANPKRIAAAADSNFSFWHSATFSNDGTKVLFTDEWGGGGQPRCRATDKKEWGADAIFTLANGRDMQFQSYYKLPAAQTPQENCVAHNGSLIPVPGREVMVQGWYQGGISVFDWTDPQHAREIAFFDRGPVDSTKMTMGGSWSVYWYNGKIVSSEIARGLDIFELTASPLLSQNEIDAAKTVHFDYLNAQDQQKFVWPATFVLARAYLDQLQRNNGLDHEKIEATRKALDKAEKLSGQARKDALSALATSLHGYMGGAGDSAKVHTLALVVGALN